MLLFLAKRLTVGGLRIHIQKSFENSLLQRNNSRNKSKTPFQKNASSKPPRMNSYPGTKIDTEDLSQYDELPFTTRDIFRGTRPVPFIVLQSQHEKQQQRYAAQLRRQQHRVHQGPVMTKAQYLARRRSAQFHIREGNQNRKSRLQGDQLKTKDSIDSLEPILGSLLDEQKKVAKKSMRKSQMPHPDEDHAHVLTFQDDDNNEDEGSGEYDEYEEDQMSDDDEAAQNTGGKIRFEIPAPSEQGKKDSEFKAKIRERRPTSVRTTRFTMPDEGETNREKKDPDVAAKIRARRVTSAVTKTTKTPQFTSFPEKIPRDRRESLKIRQRRPTPVEISPMFASIPDPRALRYDTPEQLAQEKRQGLPLLEKGARLPKTPHTGIHTSIAGFPGMTRGRFSQPIQKRSKTPEVTEGAQELKKTPLTNRKKHHSIFPGPTGTESKNDLATLKILENDDEPENGLMRIKKRRNIGRVLTPPFSKNERSSSLAVLDFRSSMFYKRNKSRGPSTARRSNAENKRIMINMMMNKKVKNNNME